MVSVSLAARKSKSLSGAPKVAVIDPEVPALSAATGSAPASTAVKPLGSVAPPDQVIDARLALNALSFKSVKVRVAVGAMSSVMLPMVLRTSMIGCSPASAVSAGGCGGWSWTTSTNPEVVGAIDCDRDLVLHFLGPGKIDRLQLQRSIESLGARSPLP